MENRTHSAFAGGPESPHEQEPTAAGALERRRRLAGAYFIAVERVRPDPAPPRRRLDSQAQQELAQSVRQFGVMQPITVRFIDAHDVYQIISGERRYHAAVAAGLAELPCRVQTPRDEEVLLRQVVENRQRRDLSPCELADALASIREAHQYSHDELAGLTGKPKGEISNLLALLPVKTFSEQAATQ